MSAVVVEFVGLPGSGKSHLARELLLLLDARGVAAGSTGLCLNHEWSRSRRIATKLAWGGQEVVTKPKRSLAAARSLAHSGQRRRRDAVRLWSELLAVERLLRSGRRRDGVEVLDEGVFQLLWSVELDGRAGAARELATALAAAPGGGLAPDVLVVVEAPLDVVLERLDGRERSDSRVDRLAPGARRMSLERGVEILGRLTAPGPLLPAGAPKPHVIMLHNGAGDADPHRFAPVLAAVEAMLGGAAAER